MYPWPQVDPKAHMPQDNGPRTGVAICFLVAAAVGSIGSIGYEVWVTLSFEQTDAAKYKNWIFAPFGSESTVLNVITGRPARPHDTGTFATADIAFLDVRRLRRSGRR
jgi:hypothetical protein